MQSQFRAHSNIALIKYWGKADEQLHLPYNSSLSLTLDAFYTDTRVEFSPDLSEDYFLLNQDLQSQQETEKITTYLDLFRSQAKINYRAKVESFNNMPAAAGFGSSASAYAALAAATSSALGLNMSLQELSIMARKGSGSACRSIYPGLVIWEKGNSDQTSFALPFDSGDWGLAAITVITSKQVKSISSRQGMKNSVETSPYYSKWLDVAANELAAIKAAIKSRDIKTIGAIAEHNALSMHALTMTSTPPLFYFNPNTLRAIKTVETLRQEGYLAYFTVDAGPNIVILTSSQEVKSVCKRFKELNPEPELIISLAGPGIEELEVWPYA